MRHRCSRLLAHLARAVERAGGFKAWTVTAILMLAFAGTASAGTTDVLSRVAGMDVGCYERIPGFAAEGQTPSGMYASADAVTGRETIYLTTLLCSRLALDIRGKQARRQMGMTMRGLAWRTLGHEVAHSEGYDHGALTIGADCASYGLFMRPLMLAAGLDLRYTAALLKAVKRTGPCIKWVAA